MNLDYFSISGTIYFLSSVLYCTHTDIEYALVDYLPDNLFIL